VRKLSKIIAARVSEVVSGDIPSFFLHGPAGHGKTHAITEELDTAPGHTKWLHWNSHMTARSLVEHLYYFRRQVHVFEDMEPLYKNATAAGILRSACASAKGRPRVVTYSTHRDHFEFVFEGGVIIVSNEDLSNHGVLGAVASRMRPLKWELRPDEMVALIREIAAGGFTHRGHKIPPKECQEVAEYLIGAIGTGKYKIDLRTFCDHALPTYANWRRTHAGCKTWTNDVHWTDIVKSKIQGEAVIEKRQERVDRERATACICYRDGNNTQARIDIWRKRTGWSKQAFYNRLKEAKATGLFEQIVGR
jgi:hypothetical protein